MLRPPSPLSGALYVNEPALVSRFCQYGVHWQLHLHSTTLCTVYTPTYSGEPVHSVRGLLGVHISSQPCHLVSSMHEPFTHHQSLHQRRLEV